MTNFYYGRRRRTRREINPKPADFSNDRNKRIGGRLATFKFLPDCGVEQKICLTKSRPLFLGACMTCTVSELAINKQALFGFHAFTIYPFFVFHFNNSLNHV